MATYRIAAPDGATYQISGPDGATQEQIQAEVIRQNPHLAAPAKSRVDQIPDTPAAPSAAPESSAWDTVKGLAEVPLALASGAVRGVVAPVYGVAKSVAAGKYGTPEGVQYAQQQAEQMPGFFQPRTQFAQETLGAISKVTEPLIGATPLMTQGAALAGPAARQAGAAVRAEIDLAKQPRDLMAVAREQTAKSAQSWADAPKIDAAKAAQQHGYTIAPDFTKADRRKLDLAGRERVYDLAAAKNEENTVRVAKREMGVPDAEPLTGAAYDRVIDRAAAPYREIRNVTDFSKTDGAVARIQRLQDDIPLIEDAANQAAATRLIDRAVEVVNSGLSGDDIIKSISDLRLKARNAYKSTQLTSAEQILADTRIGIANALEQLIDDNITDPKLLQQYRDARATIAKAHAYKDATNLATGKIDHAALAKIVEKDNALTGAIKDIGTIAANFPKEMRTGVKPRVPILNRFSRASAAGALGLAAGSAVGLGIPGMLAGAAAGEVGSALLARRLLSRGYQAERGVPPDFRQSMNQLGNVPYRGVPALYEPPVERGVPNWTAGAKDPYIEPYVESVPPNRLAPPSGEATAANVLRQRQGEYQSAAFREMEAQRAAEQAAAAQRTPTRGGQVYDIDPVTGRLRAADEGLRGATPDVVRNTGDTLVSAAEKLSAGQGFALSAEERIAWSKTKAALADALPEFRGRSDKEVIARMFDRKEAEAAIQKLRDRAAAFAEIDQRGQSAEAARKAAAQREVLLDLADDLEEQLRRQPTRKLGQGPKTRNALSQQNNQNALAQ